MGDRRGEETAAFFKDFPDQFRLNDHEGGVIGSLAKLEGAAQETVERRVHSFGFGEVEAELSDHLAMAGVLQTFRQEHRLRDVKAPVVSARDGEVRVALYESGLGRVEGSFRLLEERIDLVQAACSASFRTILRKDVSPLWYAS